MIVASSSGNPLFQQASDIAILIIGTLGVGSFVSSYFLFRFQANQENKKKRQEIAEKIISEVYSYNVTIGNELLLNSSKENNQRTDKEKEESHLRFTQAAKSYNEAIALADLYIGKKAVVLLEEILKLIPKIQQELKNSLETDKPVKNRHETDAGKEFDKKLIELNKILKKYIG